MYNLVLEQLDIDFESEFESEVEFDLRFEYLELNYYFKKFQEKFEEDLTNYLNGELVKQLYNFEQYYDQKVIFGEYGQKVVELYLDQKINNLYQILHNFVEVFVDLYKPLKEIYFIFLFIDNYYYKSSQVDKKDDSFEEHIEELLQKQFVYFY